MTGGDRPALARGIPARGGPARALVGIGQVLEALRQDFPDVSPSKIRFLEAEGLIAPERASSGYRRFAVADIERLRFILTAQRDEYLPLRVIKERLTRPDPPAEPGVAGPPTSDGMRGHRSGPDAGLAGAASEDGLLSRSELVAAAGLTEALLTELETFGLIRRLGRQYGQDALQVARAAAALTAYGVEARHLRAVRAAAERETAMIESLVAPILRQRSKGARDLAAQTAAELADEVLRLHGALVVGALAEAGLAGAAPPRSAADAGAASAGPAAGPAAGLAGHRDAQRLGRGVAGASA
jgi:DNA-binding transcriptional MerR regulator